MPKFVLSTIAWVESIAKKEIEKQGWIIEEVIDRLITFSWDLDLMIKVNLWSRVGNKLYLLLGEKEKITDFDNLFDLVSTINWKNYIKKNHPIIVKTSTIRSELSSAPAIQKITKKAIINSINNNSWEFIFEDEKLEKIEIFILILDNKVRILLNTSGKALHMRWYRTEAWEAPIKESLAAALVLLSDWKFKENFLDPFCWSWTIPIEALMIAKNIAPGLNRTFAFENLWFFDKNIIENEKNLAKQKQFSWKYKIFASDLDSSIIEIAKNNAIRAWLENEINFSVKDLKDYFDENLSWTLVSNPPYWERLKSEDLKWLYNNIDKLFRLNSSLWWWIISSYLDFDTLIKKQDYKKRKLYNGWEMCYFWKRN